MLRMYKKGVVEDETKRKGLAKKTVVRCRYCSFCLENYNAAKNLANSGKGMQPFDINMRRVYTMCACGVGHTGLETLCGFMNMPPPMVREKFDSDRITFVMPVKRWLRTA